MNDGQTMAEATTRIADVNDESRQRLLAAAERFRDEQTCGFPGCSEPVASGPGGGRSRQFCARREHNAQSAYSERQKHEPPLPSPWKQRLAERDRVIREVYAADDDASVRGIAKVFAEAGVSLHWRQVWRIVTQTPPVALMHIVAGDPDGGPHVHVVLELDHVSTDVTDEELAKWREHGCAGFAIAFGAQPEAVVVYVEDQADDVATEAGS